MENIQAYMKQDMEDRINGKHQERMMDSVPAKRQPLVKEVADGVANKKNQVGVDPSHPLSLMGLIIEESNWVDLGVNVIAAACSSTNPLFRISTNHTADYKKKPREKQIDDLTDLLNFPNLNQTGEELWDYTYRSLALYGNAYWQVIKSMNGELHSIYSLPPESLRVVPWLDANKILHFDYIQIGVTKEPRLFTEDEIIHFKRPNTKSFCYGKPLFYSQLLQIAASINAKKSIANWFEEGYVGGAIFKMDADAEVADRNRQYLRDMYTKPENFGAVMLLEGGTDLVKDGNKFKDFDFSALSDTDRDNILMSAGIPLSMAGVRSAAGQANSDIVTSEEKAFNRNIVNAFHKIVFSTINNKLFRQILNWKDVIIEPGVLDKFSMADAIDIVKAAAQFSGITPNETRDLLSMARIPAGEVGNMYLLATNNGTIPADKILGKDYHTGEEVETIFDVAQQAADQKANELTSGAHGLGGDLKDKANGK